MNFWMIGSASLLLCWCLCVSSSQVEEAQKRARKEAGYEN
jgi:hypothetical protein